MKNPEIIENVWKILPGDGSQKREVSGQNGRVGISGFVTLSSTFPSSLLKLSVLVYVPGSIFKMAESNSNSNSDAFCIFHRLYSSSAMHNGGRT